MKKLISLSIALLLLTGAAIAEPNEYSFEGEWYVGSLYSEQYRHATLDEEGVFHVQFSDEETLFHPDGTIESTSESEKLSVIEISDQSTLYYTMAAGWSGQKLACCLFLNMDDEFRYYSFSCSNELLLIGGNIISNKGEDSIQYLYSHGKFYMTRGNEYESGVIQWHGDDMFIFEMESEPKVVEYESGSHSMGVPWMVFISTSIQ